MSDPSNSLRVQTIAVAPGTGEIYASGVEAMQELWRDHPLHVPHATDAMDIFAALRQVPPRTQARVIKGIVVIDDQIRASVGLPRRSEFVHTGVDVMNTPAQLSVEGLSVVASASDTWIGVADSSAGSRTYESGPTQFLLMSGRGDIHLEAPDSPADGPAAVLIRGLLRRY